MSGIETGTLSPLNAEVSVKITENKLKASILLTSPGDGGNPATAGDIAKALEEAGVIYGIKSDVVDSLAANPEYLKPFVVAEATPPIDGDDAVIEYRFQKSGAAKPRVSDDGSVDFKQLDIVKNIVQGDVLCVKIPATKGTPGTDVEGRQIAPNHGRDVVMPAGKNTVESDDGLTLTSGINGQVDLVGGRVCVMDAFNVSGSVDYNTGNIDFVGNVTVGGDVYAGFLVKADGNVHIKGCVDGGSVEAKGNIIIENGVNGQSGKIICGGDLRCKYLQNASIDAGGDVETTSCINSTVHAGKTVRLLGSQAMILASRVVAGKAVETRNIGSRSSTVDSIVEVGINPRIAERALQIPVEISKIGKNVESINKLVELYKQLAAQNRLSEDKKAEYVKVTAALKSSEQELELLKLEKENVDESLKNLGYGIVSVSGTAFAGTQISIGSEKRTLETDCKFMQFSRSKDGIEVNALRR